MRVSEKTGFQLLFIKIYTGKDVYKRQIVLLRKHSDNAELQNPVR